MSTIKSNELSATEKDVLLRFHRESRQQVLSEIDELTKELADIDARIALLSGDDVGHQVEHIDQIKLPIANGYDKRMSLPQKAIFILRELKKTAYVTDIFDRLASFEIGSSVVI